MHSLCQDHHERPLIPGDLDAVKELMKRGRDSMDAILHLQELPDMKLGPNEETQLAELRDNPLDGEKVVFWAIQDGDNLESRKVLPRWLSSPIERAVSKFVEENNSWNAKIESRMELGKPLAPSVQKAYDKWCNERSSCNLLFSKVKKTVVHSIRSNADANRMRNELFSIHIQFSIDPEHLLVRAANGASRKLVFLQGEATQETGLPAFLDHRPSPEQVQSAIDEMPGEDAEEAECAEDEDEDMALKCDQEAAHLEEDMGAQTDVEEILADSSEDELLQTVVDSKHRRVKSFHHRPAYCKLKELGLTDIPCVLPGVFLGFHSTTRTWQGWFPEVHHGLSWTFGGTTGRSEPEALLRTIRGILLCHMARFPKDRMWQKQLDKVLAAEATIHQF